MANPTHRSPKVRQGNPTLAEIAQSIRMLADGRLDNEAIRTLGEVEDDATRETFRELIGIETGTYTPAVTAVSGVDAASGNTSRWVRIGTKVVIVFFSINIDPTSTGAIQVDISLPVASDFAVGSNAAGMGANQDGGAGRISANATDDRVSLFGNAPVTNNRVWNGSFMYVIM